MTLFLKPLLLTPFMTAAVFVAAFALPACSNASSAEQVLASESVAAAPRGDIDASHWTILPDASHIKFSALQEGVEFNGAFESFSGQINFDPENPEAGTVIITIPLKGFDAGSKDRNSTVPGKIWFSAKKFPEARFTSTEISKQETGFLAKGELTLKGITLPIDLPFELQIDGSRAVMTGQVKLDRTRWSVGAAPWDTDEWVSRDVNLNLQVTADRRK